jgi:hypothetical protein
MLRRSLDDEATGQRQRLKPDALLQRRFLRRR